MLRIATSELSFLMQHSVDLHVLVFGAKEKGYRCMKSACVCVCACEYVSGIVSHSHWKLFQKNRIAMGIVWRVCVCVWYTRAFSLCALPIYNGKISNKIASYAHTGQAKRFVARYSDYMFIRTLFLARRFGFYCHTPCDEVDYPLFSAIRACRTNMNSSRKLSIGSLNLEWNEAVPLKMYALYKMPRI